MGDIARTSLAETAHPEGAHTLARVYQRAGLDRGCGMAMSAYPEIPAAEKIHGCGVIGTQNYLKLTEPKN